MRLQLKIWRQAGPKAPGKLVDYVAEGVSTDMSFLEMLDVVNEGLTKKGDDAIAFDSDCREGICGMCSLVVNGVPHGPDRGTTVCQLHMRRFKDGETITVEPWRAAAFPVVKDLIVDRSAFDRIISSGGYVSVNVGGAQDGYLRAYETATGKPLWEHRLPAGGNATPMSYLSTQSGRQFLVIYAGGYGGLKNRLGDYVVAFALPKSTVR